MTFNESLTAYTTAFGQNCLLNCAAHKIIEVLLKTDPQALDENHPLNLVKQSFNDYYSFSKDNNKKSLADIQQLFLKVKNPLDREYILGPVLRQCLIKNLENSYSDTLLNEDLYGFKKVISNYLETNNIEYGTLNPNLALSNKHFILKIDQYYLAWKNNNPEGNIGQFFQSKPEDNQKTIAEHIENYWTETGSRNYLNMLEGGAELMAFEASTLLENLGIMLIDYSIPDMPNTYPPKVSLAVPATLELYSKEDHWQYLDEHAKEHNAHYMRDEKKERYYTYATGGNYPSILMEVIEASKADALGIRHGITKQIEAIFKDLPVVHDATNTSVSTSPLHIDNPPQTLRHQVIKQPKKDTSLKKARWVQMANHTTTKEPEQIDDFSEALYHLFNPEDQSLKIPAPSVKQSLLVKKEQIAALSIIQPEVATVPKDVCEVSKTLDTRFQSQNIAVVRSASGASYNQPQQDGGNTAVLKITADEIVCEKINAFATKILLEHLVELAIVGHRNIVIKGGTENYSQMLLQEAKNRVDERLQGLSQEEKDSIFSSATEKSAEITDRYQFNKK